MYFGCKLCGQAPCSCWECFVHWFVTRGNTAGSFFYGVEKVFGGAIIAYEPELACSQDVTIPPSWYASIGCVALHVLNLVRGFKAFHHGRM